MLANNVTMSLCAFSTWAQNDKLPPCDTCSPPQRRWSALGGPLCGCGSSIAVCWVEVGTGAPCTKTRINNKQLLRAYRQIPFNAILSAGLSWPLVVALLLVRFQIIHDEVQEFTFLLWKISIEFHRNRETQGGREKAGPAGGVVEMT